MVLRDKRFPKERSDLVIIRSWDLIGMLKAIISGTMDRWELDDGKKISARQVYRDLEDHLTAAVFGRLVYLPNEIVWRILGEAKSLDKTASRHTFRAHPPITDVSFWPRYLLEPESEKENLVIPDVVIRTPIFSLIVEAKRWDTGTPQSVTQIDNEIRAYRSSQDTDLPVCVLLMGGHLPHDFTVTEKNVELLRLPWHRLRRAINTARRHLPKRYANDHYQRILADIDAALELHGVVHWITLDEIPENLITQGLEARSHVEHFVKIGAPVA